MAKVNKDAALCVLSFVALLLTAIEARRVYEDLDHDIGCWHGSFSEDCYHSHTFFDAYLRDFLEYHREHTPELAYAPFFRDCCTCMGLASNGTVGVRSFNCLRDLLTGKRLNRYDVGDSEFQKFEDHWCAWCRPPFRCCREAIDPQEVRRFASPVQFYVGH